MARPKPPASSLLIVAIFSRHPAALDWAAEKITATWGPIGLSSPRWEHVETDYYSSEMGTGLQKQLLAVDGSFEPSLLPQVKLQSNAWEHELALELCFPEIRPLNIDPGYLTLSKFVLASAKDRAHRIYLSGGIYAEQCLHYLDQRWLPRPWTYPDYKRQDVLEFFHAARERLKSAVRSG